jgi:hypothetical protein
LRREKLQIAIQECLRHWKTTSLRSWWKRALRNSMILSMSLLKIALICCLT